MRTPPASFSRKNVRPTCAVAIVTDALARVYAMVRAALSPSVALSQSVAVFSMSATGQPQTWAVRAPSSNTDTLPGLSSLVFSMCAKHFNGPVAAFNLNTLDGSTLTPSM